MIRISFFSAVILVIGLTYCSCNAIVNGIQEQDNAKVDPSLFVNEKVLSNDDIKIDIEKEESDQSLLAQADRLPHEVQSIGDERFGDNKPTSIEPKQGLSRVKRCGGGDDDDDDGDANRSRRSRRARRRRASRAKARRARKARRRAAKRARKSSTTTTTVTRQIIQDGQVVSSTAEQNGQPTVVINGAQQGVAQVQQPVVVQQNPSVATVQPVNQSAATVKPSNQSNQGPQPSNSQATTPQLLQQPQGVPQQVAANQQAPVQIPVANPPSVSTSFSAQGSVKV